MNNQRCSVPEHRFHRVSSMKTTEHWFSSLNGSPPLWGGIFIETAPRRRDNLLVPSLLVLVHGF